jgi:Mn-containing catalase
LFWSQNCIGHRTPLKTYNYVSPRQISTIQCQVSRPDPRFANLLLEQFGGENGELAAAMQYFTQAFGAKVPHPDKYDMLMDIATEEFSHLEIVGATIQMLLKGVAISLMLAAGLKNILKSLYWISSLESVACAGI